jgi:hypothetical protein
LDGLRPNGRDQRAVTWNGSTAGALKPETPNSKKKNPRKEDNKQRQNSRKERRRGVWSSVVLPEMASSRDADVLKWAAGKPRQAIKTFDAVA